MKIERSFFKLLTIATLRKYFENRKNAIKLTGGLKRKIQSNGLLDVEEKSIINVTSNKRLCVCTCVYESAMYEHSLTAIVIGRSLTTESSTRHFHIHFNKVVFDTTVFNLFSLFLFCYSYKLIIMI